MDATVILIDGDTELARARALVERLWNSDDPADIARLEAQARLIAAYEEHKWPRRSPNIADLICHLMDQHDLTRADMVPILGTPSRVSEVLRGKKGTKHRDGAEIARPISNFSRSAATPAQEGSGPACDKTGGLSTGSSSGFEILDHGKDTVETVGRLHR